MTTELRSSDKCRTLASKEVCIKGWRHIHALSCMEGDLMVISAEQGITGQVDDLHLHQLSNIAWLFAQEGYTDTQKLSAGVAALAHTVEQLALEISTYEWSWWIKSYQEEEESMRLAAEEDELRRIHVSHHTENGTEYQSLPYRGNSTDGIVYLPGIVPDSGNFEVRELYHERDIAIVAGWADAVAIARYAASHDGGFGDVIIRITEQGITHSNFESWFTD